MRILPHHIIFFLVKTHKLAQSRVYFFDLALSKLTIIKKIQYCLPYKC